jgi:RNA polymerase sigma factor (sigma-70 family)
MADKIFIAEALVKLKAFKAQDDQASFNLYIEKVFPQIAEYLNAQLELAVKKKNIHEGNYNVADFMADLYIKAYEHIRSIEKGEYFKIWLYRTADQLLQEAITDDQFDEYFFKNLDEFSQAEIEEMEENYSTDGDGDFVLEEELDDISYSKNDYELKDVFVEDDVESEIIADLDQNIRREKISHHIQSVMPKLSNISASILELFSRHKLNEWEIAEVKGLSVESVKSYLNEARNAIKMSLSNKFRT